MTAVTSVTTVTRRGNAFTPKQIKDDFVSTLSWSKCIQGLDQHLAHLNAMTCHQIATHPMTIEQRILDTNAGKQLS